MICERARRLTIRSLGSWPADTLRYTYPEAGILLTYTPVGFGGKRAWFLCPRCDRRCGVLYDNAGRGWFCRICSNARYASEAASPIKRLYRKARKLRRRLGGDTNMIQPFPAKPKGMHWSTYLRLRKEGKALEARIIEHLHQSLPSFARGRADD